MSIGGGPEFAVAQPDQPLPPSTDRTSSRPVERPVERPIDRPTSQPAQDVAGDGLLVVVYGEDSGANVAEQAVLRSLRTRRGIRVMDATSLGIVGGDHSAVQSAIQDGNFASLADLVRERGGEFIFIGTLESSARRQAIGPMFSGAAQLELRMYRVSTGEIFRAGHYSVGMVGELPTPGASD